MEILKVENKMELEKVFSLNYFEENEKKALEILKEVKGNSLEEKLKTLSEIALTFNEINNKEIRDYANKYRNQVVAVRTAITRTGKSFRDFVNLTIKKEQKIEKEFLSLFEEGEKTLKSKIEEFDKMVAREERRVTLPVRLKMLEEIDLVLTEEEILDLDEKQFPVFFYSKKAEYDQKIENERLAKIEELHKKRFSILVESGLFQFLTDKYQKFGELEENDFLILVENCEKRKEEENETREIEIEKAKKEAVEKENNKYQDEQKQEKEKNEKDARFNAWKSANSYNEKTDFIKFEEGKATLWRKISIINY